MDLLTPGKLQILKLSVHLCKKRAAKIVCAGVEKIKAHFIFTANEKE